MCNPFQKERVAFGTKDEDGLMVRYGEQEALLWKIQERVAQPTQKAAISKRDDSRISDLSTRASIQNADSAI